MVTALYPGETEPGVMDIPARTDVLPVQQQHLRGTSQTDCNTQTRIYWPLPSCNSISTSWERPGDPSLILKNHLVFPFIALPQSACDGPFTWQSIFIACSTSLCWANPDLTHKKQKKRLQSHILFFFFFFPGQDVSASFPGKISASLKCF